MCEHFEILAVTGKMVKGDDDSAIKEYLLLCNHLSILKIAPFSLQQQRL